MTILSTCTIEELHSQNIEGAIGAIRGCFDYYVIRYVLVRTYLENGRLNRNTETTLRNVSNGICGFIAFEKCLYW